MLRPLLSLGVEEELQVIDPTHGGLVDHNANCPPMTAFLAERNAGGMTTEIHRCVLETQTPVCRHPDDVIEAMARLRLAARDRCELQGQSIAAAGLHPFSRWEDQSLYGQAETHPHYAHLIHEYADVARGAMSFGLHVHLGLPEAVHGARIPVMNALRTRLPHLLALSASSPFHAGRDTGLQTWRHSLMERYPRMGIPEIWESEEHYFQHLDRLRENECIHHGMGLWGDLRLHHRYGTLEVRIADVVADLERVWLIVALLQTETLVLLDEWSRGALAAPCPRWRVEENKWRARRHGLKARMLCEDGSNEASAENFLGRWLERVEPVGEDLGLGDRLRRSVQSALEEGTLADRYRQQVADGQSLTELIRSISAHTVQSAQTVLNRSKAPGHGGIET